MCLALKAKTLIALQDASTSIKQAPHHCLVPRDHCIKSFKSDHCMNAGVDPMISNGLMNLPSLLISLDFSILGQSILAEFILSCSYSTN